MEFLTELWSYSSLLKIICSITSSFIFIFTLLYFLRPKIKISPEIGYSNFDFEVDEPPFYLFKIVNKSRFSLYNISIKCVNMTSYPVEGGTNWRLEEIKMKSPEMSHMGPLPFFWQKNNGADFATIFRTYENIREHLNKTNNKIRIEVIGRHGLTGLLKVYFHEYTNVNCIKNGQFKFGNHLNIV